MRSAATAAPDRWRSAAAGVDFVTGAVAAHLSLPFAGRLYVSTALVGSSTPWRLLRWLGLPTVLVAALAALTAPGRALALAAVW